MIEKIEHRGVLIPGCTLPDETRAEDVFPAHCNGIPVSRDKWLVVYATRGFAGIDDDRSIVYQLRHNSPDGELIKEGWLSRCVDDWQPLEDGRAYRKEHGHPVAFGVPKDAIIDGETPLHAGLFVVKWRVLGKVVEEGRVSSEHGAQGPTQGVEWVQFRLNQAEDDIVVLQPPRPLRQQEYESGGKFCERDFTWMNQAFVQAVPFSDDCTQWADVNHFYEGRIAALKYSYSAQRDLYEWTQTGPALQGGETELIEASLLRYGSEWIIAGRTLPANGPAWFRINDLFAESPSPVLPGEPPNYAPLSVYSGADGNTYLFTGDPNASPYGNGRNPLYCWEVDPDDGFAAANRRVVFDAKAAGLPIRPEAGTVVDMCKLLPHTGGREQYIVHRVRPKAINFTANTKAVVNDEEKKCAGIYYAKVRYDRDYPALWSFGESN